MMLGYQITESLFYMLSLFSAFQFIQCLKKIMVGFAEALSQNTRNASHSMLYLYVPPLERYHGWPPQCFVTFPHAPLLVTEVRNATFPVRWIGRCGLSHVAI